MKGRRLRAAGTVRMKGGESRPDHGDENPRFGPDKHGPGVEDATSGAPEGGVPRKGTRAPSPRCQTEMVRHSALRSLTHVREKGKEGGPRASQIAGAMNHVCKVA